MGPRHGRPMSCQLSSSTQETLFFPPLLPGRHNTAKRKKGLSKTWTVILKGFRNEQVFEGKNSYRCCCVSQQHTTGAIFEPYLRRLSLFEEIQSQLLYPSKKKGDKRSVKSLKLHDRGQSKKRRNTANKNNASFQRTPSEVFCTLTFAESISSGVYKPLRNPVFLIT